MRWRHTKDDMKRMKEFTFNLQPNGEEHGGRGGGIGMLALTEEEAGEEVVNFEAISNIH